ncbi:hypothetical protein V1264_016636 [Littorina saxatilis]|uniref:Uncharacterized protein n=1 Tax=Littorina saxatilis TaxID=31220 RepID=A0AAN9GFT8_9CAEN
MTAVRLKWLKWLGFAAYNQRQAESSLIQMLLADYDPDVRPVLNHTSSVSVHLMFTPVRIDDLDLRGEDLKLTGWLGMTWTDEMFQWQPRNESGVRYLLLSHKDYWVPPITVLNSLKGLFASHDQTHSSKVSVRWDGTSHYAISDNFAISCDVNIHYFPFDHQTCDVTFLSWYHPMTQMVLTSEAKDIDMRHYEEDGEWRLLSTGVTVSPHNISLHPFHADDVTFSRVCFTFSVLRRPRYYMINVLLPCLLLCVLVLINFFLPPDSGEKVSLGITVLLAFTVFQLLIAEVIPTSASETPLLAVYLICIMAMSTLSVIMSVCVLNLHHRTVYSHPPPWLRHLVLHYLARAMYMQISHVTGKIQPVREWKEKEQSSTPNLTTSVSPARRNSANDTKIT